MTIVTNNQIPRQAAILLVVLIMLLPISARAGVVWALDGRHEGDVSAVTGGLKVGQVQVQWDDVLIAAGAGNDAAAHPNTVHLANGEAWTGTVTDLTGGKLTIESPLLGKQVLPVAHVMAVDFVPHLPAPPAAVEKTLYRVKGRPVTGSLVWIKTDKVAVDTAVGAVALDRAELVRFVFTGKSAPASTSDEITLTDGSILHGKVAPGAGTMVLTHPVLGAKTIPAGAWQSVRRNVPGVVHLATISATSVKTFPLIRRPADPPSIVRSRGENAAGNFVRRLRVHPKTIATYAVDRPAGTAAILRMQVALAQGTRGSARVKLLAGDKALFDEVLTVDKPRRTVSLNLPGAAALVVEVDFDKTVRLPCSVVLDDPHVIVRK